MVQPREGCTGTGHRSEQPRRQRLHRAQLHHLSGIHGRTGRERPAMALLRLHLLRPRRLRRLGRFHHRRRVSVHGWTRRGSNQSGRREAHLDPRLERGDAASRGADRVPPKAVPDVERAAVVLPLLPAGADAYDAMAQRLGGSVHVPRGERHRHHGRQHQQGPDARGAGTDDGGARDSTLANQDRAGRHLPRGQPDQS